MGGGRAPLTSPRLAHEGHDLAWRQREGEVLEHLEARAAGVTGRSQETLSQTRFQAPCCPGLSGRLPEPPPPRLLKGRHRYTQVAGQRPSPVLSPDRTSPASTRCRSPEADVVK